MNWPMHILKQTSSVQLERIKVRSLMNTEKNNITAKSCEAGSAMPENERKVYDKAKRQIAKSIADNQHLIDIQNEKASARPENVREMTAERWDSMSHVEREKVRDYSQLSPQLKDLRGYRVEVVTTYGEKRRFIVGQSTGWSPINLEIHNRRCYGGQSAEKHYKSVRVLYKAS